MQSKTKGGFRSNQLGDVPLTALELGSFLQSAPSQTFPAGAELFTQGFPLRDVYLIERGLVKLVRLESNGQEIIVGLRSAGWVLGAAWAIIQGGRCPVTATTLTVCCLRRFLAGAFCDLMRTDAQLSWYVHNMHSREITDQVIRLGQIGCVSARQRLEQLIWQLIRMLDSGQSQKGIRLQLPLKHEEVAKLIVVTPTYLSRLLNELERDGTIRREKGWMIIPEPQKLWHNEELLAF
jgi:CRP-like cAMP-binding protein